ncbi:MAG TPA: D-alanine--D-alanine ligase [Bacteroidetes bacterium]|nr:D-alanine--D-alanine ligase [Bacteroidota bacterium]
MSKIRVGIFFGGSSREREISFAGGRTVYDNLNKTLFEPVPIFVDSFHNFILLDWQFIYKGSIRDFYPPVSALPNTKHAFQVYIESLGNLSAEKQNEIISQVGKKILPHELSSIMDFAFLALHGSYAEDGSIQGLLDFHHIPYSGSGVLPSAIGINKAFQKRMMNEGGFTPTKFKTITRKEWLNGDKNSLIKNSVDSIGVPLVVRPANQGSSIGVSIIHENDSEKIKSAIERAFFFHEWKADEWKKKTKEEKISHLAHLCDIRESVGLPVLVGDKKYFHPEELFELFESLSQKNISSLTLEAEDAEVEILLEEFIEGKEFSCIVLADENGNPVALPPTEIVKGKEVFDYRSKYLAGLSRKITPIQIPDEQIEAIRNECEKLFSFFSFHVYARIDGFIRKDGKIILNDPNTTSGMLPSSFFFHQAAEIGLNPSQFLTYIIHTSIRERMRTTVRPSLYSSLLAQINSSLEQSLTAQKSKRKIAVILGGYSTERHISVESGRNIYEKLASSDKYEPIPVFLFGNDEQHELYQIPINLLLKDNADDIREKILHFSFHPVIEKIKKRCSNITSKFSSKNYLFTPRKISYNELPEIVEGVFIALHGRPGEDGSVQSQLEKVSLPYNGSGVTSSQITINKFNTNQLLLQNGFHEAQQTLVQKKDWKHSEENFLSNILLKHKLPLIAKPVDDGCSSAVKKIKTREELASFSRLMFREEELLNEKDAAALKLKPKEEFPRKQQYLVEDLISSEKANHFLEITCGMLTHLNEDGSIRYEVFEPSETLAGADVLSLEEKFLAGEGQNITPARFAKSKNDYEAIASQVKKDLERAARLLNVRGYCRIDAFVRIYENNKAETVIIEVNSLPGMTPATCIFHQAAINHYKPYEFIDKILEFSRQNQKQHQPA